MIVLRIKVWELDKNIEFERGKGNWIWKEIYNEEINNLEGK